MRRRRLLGGVMVLVMGLLAALPIQAQTPDELTPEELDLIAYVATAFEGLTQIESYTISGKQVMQMDVLGGAAGGVGLDAVGTLTIQITTDDSGNIQGADAEVSFRMDMEVDGETMTATFDYQVIYLDFIQYFQINIESDDPEFAELASLNGLWFEIDMRELFSETEAAAGDLLDVDFQTLMEMSGNQFSSTYVVPVNADTVRTITELDTQTIGGRDFRVFQLEVSPEGMLTGQVGELLDLVEQYADMYSLLNPDDADAALLANLTEFLETLKMDQRVWIDSEQNLPYRVILEYDYGEALMWLMQLMGEGESVDEMNFGVSSDVTYSDFDAPFEVEPPDNTIPLPADALLE